MSAAPGKQGPREPPLGPAPASCRPSEGRVYEGARVTAMPAFLGTDLKLYSGSPWADSASFQENQSHQGAESRKYLEPPVT